MGLENVKYDAFISYRHCELDSFVSENLHKKLENFKLPKSVLKKMGLKKKKIERVFRDEAELPLSDNLSDPIMAALKNSEFLIVICSPRLPLSAWCRKEIETFVSLRDRKHVLLVLAEGEPDESFPEILLYEDVIEKDLNGNDVTIRREREPLAADCRGKNNKERLKAMDNAVIKLCAAIFNLNYDDLKQRHKEQAVKKRIVLMEIILAVVCLFAIVCLGFGIRISRQNKIISDRYASSMAMVSKELNERGRRLDAIYAARSVLPDKASDDYNHEAYYALVEAISPYNIESDYYPEYVCKIPSRVLDYKLSKSQKRLIIKGSMNDIYYCDAKTGDVITILYDDIYDFAFESDDRIIYIRNDGQVFDVDFTNSVTTKLCEDAYDILANENCDTVSVLSVEGIKGYKNGALSFEIKYSDLKIEMSEYFAEYMDMEPVMYSKNGVVAFDDGTDAEWRNIYILYYDMENGNLISTVYISGLPFEEELFVNALDDEIYYAYSSASSYEYGFFGKEIVLNIYDTKSKQTVLETSFFDNAFFQLLADDSGLCIFGCNEAKLYDFDLNQVADLTQCDEIKEVYSVPEDNPFVYGFLITDERGRVYHLSPTTDTGSDITEQLFPVTGDNKCEGRVYKNGKFFARFYDDPNMLVSYTHNPYTLAGSDDLSEYTEIPMEERMDLASWDFDSIKGIDSKAILYAIKSSDERYIAIAMADDSIAIVDAKNNKLNKIIYNEYLFRFLYFEKAECYTFGNVLFDKEFNKIAEITNGTLFGINKDSENPALVDGRIGYVQYHELAVIPYNKMIKQADKILGDYCPDKETLDRYNITKKKEGIYGLLRKSLLNK
jgi:hypothetical protein